MSDFFHFKLERFEFKEIYFCLILDDGFIEIKLQPKHFLQVVFYLRLRTINYFEVGFGKVVF